MLLALLFVGLAQTGNGDSSSLRGAQDLEELKGKPAAAPTKTTPAPAAPAPAADPTEPRVVPPHWQGGKDWQHPAIALGALFGVPILMIPVMVRMKTGDLTRLC